MSEIWKTRKYTSLDSGLVFAGGGLVFSATDADNKVALRSVKLDGEGDERWSVPLDVESTTDQVAASPDGATVYLVHAYEVYAFDAADGKQRWKTKASMSLAPGGLAVGGGKLVTSGSSAHAIAFDAATGQELWHAKKDLGPATSVTVQGDHVIAFTYGDNELVAYALDTGAEAWRAQLSGKAEISDRLATSVELSPPHPKLFFFLDSTKSVVAFDRASGKKVWSRPFDGLASFALGGDTLLMADSQSLRGIDAATGAVKWTRPSEGVTLAAPLSDREAFVQLPRSTATVEYATGKVTRWRDNAIEEQDRILDARDGAVVESIGKKTKAFRLAGRDLREQELPNFMAIFDRTAADPRAFAAHIGPGGVVAVFARGHTLSLFK